MNGDIISVPVHTSPSEATVTLNGTTYKTPANVLVPRGEGRFQLQINKEGYRSVSIYLNQSIDGWIWGNILFGGLIGLVVDFATGKAYDIDPDVITLNLQNNSVSQTDNGSLRIVLVDINDLPSSIKNNLVNAL